MKNHPVLLVLCAMSLLLWAPACENESSICVPGEACETFSLRACSCCPVDKAASCDESVQAACATGNLEIGSTPETCANNNSVWDQMVDLGDDPCTNFSEGELDDLCEGPVPAGTDETSPEDP